MKLIEVNGGYPLKGELAIHGSKNAVLPIMAASLLNKGITVIHNCPLIADVIYMADILRDVGCNVIFDKETITIDARIINKNILEEKYTKKLRASFLLLGAMLSRTGEVDMKYPGGCVIGNRPVDMHIMAIRQLGGVVCENDIGIQAYSSGLKGNVIEFEKISVGATQNAIIAAVCAKGTTFIKNAAMEPEVSQLCRCLNGMGAKISGIGTSKIKVNGVARLHDCVFEVDSDRIVAGTYMMATIATRGNITLRKVPITQMDAMVSVMQQLGARIKIQDDAVTIEAFDEINSIGCVRTEVYPGFPTDMQSQIMSVLAIAKGRSTICEEIFEGRFGIVKELNSMGADISIEGNVAIIEGKANLYGQDVYASDLRAGAALVIAGLSAVGRTKIFNTEYIERGYADICKDLETLGAQIRWMKIKKGKS